MADQMKPEEMSCANCPMRQKAEANPKSLMARIWNGIRVGALAGRLTRRHWQKLIPKG